MYEYPFLKKVIFQFFLTFLSSLALITMTSASTSHPFIELNNQGKLQGYFDNQLAIFKGIPYATPPVRSFRWFPPQPVQPWQGIKTTTEYGPNCSQYPNRWDKKETFPITSEDCLYLNIWMPKSFFGKNETQKKYPVMVWIHGGGFVSGGSNQEIFDGSSMANEGVIVVTFNYRLGRFGFFARPDLQQENEENKWANYGIMDQIAALQWVQKNISSFGGDSDNITLFGESAGGASIISLMTISEAKGLFNKAIIQSGTGHSRFFQPRTIDDAEKTGLNFAKKNNIQNDEYALENLRKLPAETIVDKLNLDDLQPDYFSGLVIDGIMLKQSLDSAFEKGAFYPVPTLIGDTSGDGFMINQSGLKGMAGKLGMNIEDLNKIYNPNGKLSETRILHQFMADIQILEPTRLLTQQIASKNVPVYRYRFSYITSSARPYTSYGAPHASELPYVFGTLNKVYSSLTPQDNAMSEAIKKYWVNFAKYSKPKVDGLSEFSEFKIHPDKLLNFSTTGIKFETDPFQSRLDYIENALKNKKKPD